MLGAERFVFPALADELVALRPSIVSHACKSTGTGYFGDRIVGATLPHAVEHLAIDLLVEHFSKAPIPTLTETFSPTFAGVTTWLDREKGCMRVRVGCASSKPYERVVCASSEPCEQASCANSESAAYSRAIEDALVDGVQIINQLLARL